MIKHPPTNIKKKFSLHGEEYTIKLFDSSNTENIIPIVFKDGFRMEPWTSEDATDCLWAIVIHDSSGMTVGKACIAADDELEEVFVSKDHRDKGICTRMISILLSYALRVQERTDLYCFPVTKDLHRFYERFGFVGKFFMYLHDFHEIDSFIEREAIDEQSSVVNNQDENN